MIKLDSSKYGKEIFEKCAKGKYEWICKSCHNYLIKGKMSPQAQANNLELCPKLKELEDLCPIELMLISQIIPFMFIVAKHKNGYLIDSEKKNIDKLLNQLNLTKK